MGEHTLLIFRVSVLHGKFVSYSPPVKYPTAVMKVKPDQVRAHTIQPRARITRNEKKKVGGTTVKENIIKVDFKKKRTVTTGRGGEGGEENKRSISAGCRTGEEPRERTNGGCLLGWQVISVTGGAGCTRCANRRQVVGREIWLPIDHYYRNV